MDQQDPTKKRKIDVDSPENDNTDGMDPSERDDRIKLMLSTMRRDDLQTILTEAAMQSNSVYEKIVAHANSDPTSRKLFIRGLAYSTTSDAVKSFFAQYGVIEEGTVVCNREGQSKGFGFITFTDLDAAHRAIKEPRKQIDGRTVFCNLAAAGNQGNGGTVGGGAGGGMVRSGGGGGDVGGDTSTRKLFVRGISYETTNDTFLHHFSRFGEVEEGGVVIDKQTDKCKGFGFVTFRGADAARKALEQPSFFLDGRTVHVNLAEEGKRNRDMGGGGGMQQQGGQQQQGGWGMQQGGQQNMQQGGFQGHNQHAAAMAAATAAWAAWNQGPRPGAPQTAQYGGYAQNPAAYQQQQQPQQAAQPPPQAQQVSPGQPPAGVPGQQQQQPQPGQQQQQAPQAGYPATFPFARPPGYMQG